MAANRLPTTNPTMTSPKKCLPTKMRLIPTQKAQIVMTMVMMPYVCLHDADLSWSDFFFRKYPKQTASPIALPAWAEKNP